MKLEIHCAQCGTVMIENKSELKFGFYETNWFCPNEKWWNILGIGKRHSYRTRIDDVSIIDAIGSLFKNINECGDKLKKYNKEFGGLKNGVCQCCGKFFEYCKNRPY